jgi:hypothetical protein
MPDDAVERDPLGSDVDLPPTLYHYTDIDGLKGIWETGLLRATNSMYLNDTSEILLGLSLVKAKLLESNLEILKKINEVWKRETDERASGNEVDDGAFDKERAELQPGLTEGEEILAAIESAEALSTSNSYIACLTEHGDQLSQWRGYANEGYCIGFDTQLLLNSLGDQRVMRRVHYYAEESNDEYAAKMIGVARGFRNLMSNRPDLDEGFRNYVIAKYTVVEAAFMKDSSFAEEGEVRIVEIGSEPDIFTPHRYGMVPRVTIPIPPGCIKSVRVGPSAHEKLKQDSLATYFVRVGFAGAEPAAGNRPLVHRSKIPFRHW